jgi:acylaminoacyl-peptidase
MRKILIPFFLSLLLMACVHAPKENEATSSKPSRIVHPSTDGVQVTDWFYPSETKTTRGLVIFLHGGPHISVKDESTALFELFRRNGYAILGVDYRGSRGYGANFQDSIKGNLGQSEISDIYSALSIVRTDPRLNDLPIYLAGESYGGYLALLIATDLHSPFKKVVAMSAPADLSRTLKNMQRCASKSCAQAAKEMQADMHGASPDVRYLSDRSPLQRVANIQVPVFIVQGEQDEFVPISLTRHFVEKADQKGKKVRLLILPKVGHDLGVNGRPEEAIRRLSPVVEFLDE